MNDRTPAPAVPRTDQALAHLFAQVVRPDPDPIVLEAARVLAALRTAAVLSGGGDEHVEHWLTNALDLSVPRRILGAHRVGACGAYPGRLVVADLAAYDHARPEHCQAVRATVMTALTLALAAVDAP